MFVVKTDGVSACGQNGCVSLYSQKRTVLVFVVQTDGVSACGRPVNGWC